MSKKRKQPSRKEAAAESWSPLSTRTRQDRENLGDDVNSGSSDSLVAWLQASTAFLIAALIVWSFVLPVDSISVFTGDAQAQNLLWLMAGLGCGALAWLKGGLLSFRKWEIVALIGAAIWLIIVSWQSGSTDNARVGWFGFWQIVALATCYWCSVSFVALGTKTRAGLVTICLMGCLATSITGLHQLAVGIPRERAEYEKDPEAVLQSLGIDAAEGSPSRLRFEARLQSPEPFATFALANSLGTLLTSGLVLLFGVAIAGLALSRNEDEAQISLLQWSMLGLCGLIILVCWFLTRSRTAYVALLAAIGFGLLGLWRRGTMPKVGRKIWIASLAGALLLCAAGIIWFIRNDELVLTQAKLSLGYRLEYWQASLEMLKDHWLTGVGLGNFQAYYPQYKLEIASEEIADPHNWVLDVATTLSLPIAVLLVAWLGRAMVRGLGSDGLSGEVDCSREDDEACLRNLLLGASFGGGFALMLTFFLLGLDLEAVLAGWVVASVAGWILFPFIVRSLSVWPQLPVVAALGMVVCLLSSGSWQASGLAVPLLVLVAAGKPQVETVPQKTWLPTLAAAAGLGIFVIQSWHPVTTAWTLHQQALDPSGQQKQLLEEAADADPLDSNLYGDLAKAELVNLFRLGPTLRQEEVEPVLASMDEWLARDEHRFTNWTEAGNLVLDLLTSTGARLSFQSASPVGLQALLLSKATSYYQQAVACYPSSVAVHAQLAVIYALSGQRDAFQAEYEETMRLSDQSPHLDKKLDQQQVYLPLDIVPLSLRRTGQNVVSAEPLLEWLRNLDLGPEGGA